ncbi:MAG: acyl-CoA dehydrogenase family protein [Dehalococcoidia bacterium]
MSRTPIDDMGHRAVGRGAIFLDGVRTPADHLIGAENRGFQTVMNAFDFSRFLIGLMCLEAVQQSLEETMAYVTSRHAFGQPPARFEGVQFPRRARHPDRGGALALLPRPLAA